jgi:3-deoxy-manno-octulosonate cytidylyltransferase (CMP-KDO synthetase)
MSATPPAFHALIPARMGSSRFPGKPLALVGGEPMVVQVARRAAASGAKRVIVATEDDVIAQAVQRQGFEAVMTGTHHTSGTERCAQAAASLGFQSDDIVVNVQGDEPLIDPALIRSVALLLAEQNCPMSTAAHPMDQPQEWANPNIVKVVLDRQQRALYFSRSLIPYPRDPGTLDSALRHIGLYAYRAEFLQRYVALEPSPLEAIEALEQLRVLWHGLPIAVYVTRAAPAPGVDTPEDLIRVNALLGS